MNVVMIGPFGLAPKQTMRMRALPLARALVRRGHRVTMLLPPWSNPQDAGTTLMDDGVQIINLKLPPRIPVLFQLLLTFALLRRALALRPDVIHCFKPKAYAGGVAWCVWQLKRLRIVRSRLVVDSDDWEGAGGWNDVERYALVLKRFFAWQERWGLHHADALTLASRALQTIAWSLGVERARVHYVPNGISSVNTVGACLERPSDPPTLLLYTRFFEFSLERLARLFARIAEQQPTLKFVIVGQGFYGEEKTFVRLLQTTCASERVTWLGWLPPNDLPDVFAHATVAIFPFDDTLLNRTKCAVKLTDLLSAGVPVVAEAVGQNIEYIVHGESGLLVRSGDEAAFVAAIAQLLDDAALRERLSVGARQRMGEQFNWDQLVTEVEAAYAAA